MTGESNPPTGPAGEPSAGGSQPGLAAEEVSLGLVLQGLLQSLSEGLIVFDREYRYRFWNPFMEKLTGLGADQVLGRRPADLFPHIAEQGVDSMLRRAMAGETVESHDLPYRVPATGREGWVVGRYFPYRNREDRIVGVVALVRDITERKRAQDALAASRQELALHNAIAEIFLTTPDDQVYEKVLRQVLSYLESPIGIFGFIDDSGDLHLPFTVPDAMDAARVDGGPVICPKDSWSGAWGAALHERRSVLANRPGALPPGHIPITRSICAPIVDRDKIIGLLAVASRSDDYTADQLRELEGKADTTAVLTSCGRFDLLKKSLESFESNSNLNLSRLIISDDSLDAYQHDLIINHYDGKYDLYIEGKNRGQASNLDWLYGLVETEFILHMEDDWEFIAPGWDDLSFKVLDNDLTIGFVQLDIRSDYFFYGAVGEEKDDYFEYKMLEDRR